MSCSRQGLLHYVKAHPGLSGDAEAASEGVALHPGTAGEGLR
jgi:hypothetical protein